MISGRKVCLVLSSQMIDECGKLWPRRTARCDERGRHQSFIAKYRVVRVAVDVMPYASM